MTNRLHNYEIIKKLGAGAHGEVYLVKHLVTFHYYCLKKMKINRQHVKEVELLSQFKHPNIIEYYEYFYIDNYMYIIMAYANQGDLQQQIDYYKQQGLYFKTTQIIDWFVQLALAIKHLHDRKIIHRDIKASNIFLTSKHLIKLGDFGIAKTLQSTLSNCYTQVGTPYYLSPEICQNQPYNHKSDIWALGVLLFYMMTLEYPFQANNLAALVYNIVNFKGKGIKGKGKDKTSLLDHAAFQYYPIELRQLVQNLLHYNPNQRLNINQILNLNFIQCHIARFLTHHKVIEEFSHTMLRHHDQKPTFLQQQYQQNIHQIEKYRDLWTYQNNCRQAQRNKAKNDQRRRSSAGPPSEDQSRRRRRR